MKITRFVTAVTLLGAASVAQAGFKPISPTTGYFPGTRGGTNAEAATGVTTGFESPFTTGAINGQQGWTGNAGANIVNTTPIAGSQSLRLTDNTTIISGNVSGAFSPIIPQPAPDGSFTSIQVRIDGVMPGPTTGGADYFIVGQSTAQLFTAFSVDFSYLGTIDVLDYPGVGQTGTLAYISSGLMWTAGTTYTLGVQFLPSPNATPGSTGATGTIIYSINGLPFYTADSLVEATSISEYVLLSDNLQVAGESATFDTLTVTGVVPEPTCVALIAIGGLFAMRRRA